MCRRGCVGSHEPLMRLAEALKSPIAHALGGKESVEWDDPYDVGTTTLIGFTLGCHKPTHPQYLTKLLGQHVVADAAFTCDVGTTPETAASNAHASCEELERSSLELLRPCFPPSRSIRLLGVPIFNLAANDPSSRPP